MPTYRAGVIGLGRMGSTFDDEVPQGGSLFLSYCHGPTYHAVQNIELVAGSDPNQEQAELFAERWRIDHDHIYNLIRIISGGHRGAVFQPYSILMARYRI